MTLSPDCCRIYFARTDMKVSRKNLIAYSSLIAVLIVGFVLYFYATSRPEYLASRADLIPEFFGISSESIGADDPDFCIDEMYNQGRAFGDFGSAGYGFNVPTTNGLLSEELSRHPNSFLNDSTIIIKVKRGDILGILTVEFDTGRGWVLYEQIYE